MRRDADVLIEDALRAIALIQQITKHGNVEIYEQDPIGCAAVERQFEIIGEALNRLSRHHPDLARTLTDLPRIIAFRNLIAHGYDVVDQQAVWQVVTTKLPALEASLQQMLPGA